MFAEFILYAHSWTSCACKSTLPCTQMPEPVRHDNFAWSIFRILHEQVEYTFFLVCVGTTFDRFKVSLQPRLELYFQSYVLKFVEPRLFPVFKQKTSQNDLLESWWLEHIRFFKSFKWCNRKWWYFWFLSLCKTGCSTSARLIKFHNKFHMVSALSFAALIFPIHHFMQLGTFVYWPLLPHCSNREDDDMLLPYAVRRVGFNGRLVVKSCESCFGSSSVVDRSAPLYRLHQPYPHKDASRLEATKPDTRGITSSETAKCSTSSYCRSRSQSPQSFDEEVNRKKQPAVLWDPLKRTASLSFCTMQKQT